MKDDHPSLCHIFRVKQSPEKVEIMNREHGTAPFLMFFPVGPPKFVDLSKVTDIWSEKSQKQSVFEAKRNDKSTISLMTVSLWRNPE